MFDDDDERGETSVGDDGASVVTSADLIDDIGTPGIDTATDVAAFALVVVDVDAVDDLA
jgi:hypothetical protein